MSRVFESNGPDVKIRGNPAHIAEKYIQLARDAQASGDPISAENYYQHAEHYYRLIAAANEAGGPDNITAIVARLLPIAKEDATPPDGVAYVPRV